ncbi:hypothetical protein FSP39_009250 [Pinctada imbricata]|uniref:Uncharacterized protein n=1 Tax=Pinctada imbricata TaxID=66713 RepID=A0AA88YH13_PINIB|nr:hypothetical protein FSP39_009250 [Pinctada imbricata]
MLPDRYRTKYHKIPFLPKTVSKSDWALHDSPSDIRAEIDRRLVEDGLSKDGPEEDKLVYVWRLYQHTETDLQRAIENEEKLKLAQTAEMQEVENYVEHIRHLSDEREALIQELETENEQLKQEIDSLKADQNASALRDETAEMLIQQGLEEIAGVSTSEQIAFLLVERARLLDELEAEQNRSATLTPATTATTPALTDDGRLSADLQRTLEKERSEFEEELSQSRESIRHMKERLKREHEEEINGLMEENNKLEDDFEEAKAKMEQLQKECNGLKEELSKEKELREKEKSDSDSRSSTPNINLKGRPPSPARTANDVALRNIIQEKTKIEGEVVQLKSHLRVSEAERDEYKEKFKSLTDEVEKLQISVQGLQMKNKSLKSELEEAEQQLDEAENLADEITKERDDMKLRLGSLEKEVKNLRAEAQKSGNLQDVVQILNKEKRDLTEELDTLKREYDEASHEKDELANQKLELSKTEVELSTQLQTMKEELDSFKVSKSELTEHKNELNRTLTLLDSRTIELESIKSEKEELSCQSESLSKENKDLLNRIESMGQELDKLTREGQEFSKKEIISSHMKDQNQKLSKEVATLKSELESQKQMESELREKIDALENSLKEQKEELSSEIDDIKYQCERQLEDLKESHENEMEDLKMKLQLTLQELSKSKQLLDEERSQCSEVEVKARDLEVLLEEMQQTNSAYENKLDEVSLLQNRVKDLEQLVSEKCDFEDQLEEKKKECSELEQEIEEFESIRLELEDTKEQLDTQRKIRQKLEGTIHDLEQVLDDQRGDHDGIQKQFSDKVQSLENQVRKLQEELFAAQDELQVTIEKHEQELEEAKAAQIELRERIEEEKQRTTSVQQSPRDASNVAHRIEAQRIENLEKQIESMKGRLSEAQKQLETVKIEKSAAEKEIKMLKDKIKRYEADGDELDTVKRELSSANRELEHLRIASKYDTEERQKHTDKIRTQEDLTKQLELDNRELAQKLQESLAQINHCEEQIKRERQRNTDKQYQSNRHMTQIESDLEDATCQVRQLRDDLQKKQTYIMKLEADAIGNAAKYESTIARLESELSEMKQFHKKELENVSERMEATTRDNKELRNNLREKEQELQQKSQECNRYKNSSDRYESQINTEIKIRTDLENRNSALDQEITKVWSQVRSLMEKNANLEAAKRSLEDELERKNSSSRQVESNYNQMTASQEATVKTLTSRAENAERRADKLQRDFDEMAYKLKTVEQQLKQAEDLKNDLQDKKEHVAQLRNQLEAEKLQRTLLDQTVAELKHQVSLLKTRETKLMEQNRELQHTMLDMESKLEDMHDRSQTAMEMDSESNLSNAWDEDQQHHYTEAGKRNMMDQISRLQKEVKDLQYELLTVNERREIQERKYEERKMKTKVKLMRARDFYAKEKTRMQEQLRQFDDDLRLTRSTLRKELDWKEKMDKNYQQLLREKREFMSQVSDLEEQLREKTRSASMLQVRTKFLEEENSRLQDRIDSLNQQKKGLDKMVKDYKVGKDRDVHLSRALTPDVHSHSITGGTSGIGNSVDSSWINEQDQYMDPLINYRLNTQTANASIHSYLNRSFQPHGHIDLYRGGGVETGSDESYGRGAFDT